MPVDYLQKYTSGHVFDFSALINDDFFQPIRVLFQARHFVSATKLLYVAVDSIAFLEYGEIRENVFCKWLDKYLDFESLEVTSEELWEHRNALLHMSSLTSRKVAAGRVRSVVCYVGQLPNAVNLNNSATGYYDLQDLIYRFGHASGRWMKTFNGRPEKYEGFFERYDLIASDARMLNIDYSEPEAGSTSS